mmetsp:Transcript_4540/g.13151  ORF Transcript_4540/g.13151 Transcript_4540/m.13151 type:complete len:83 (-) Transcript_4540:141-389(-)
MGHLTPGNTLVSAAFAVPTTLATSTARAYGAATSPDLDACAFWGTGLDACAFRGTGLGACAFRGMSLTCMRPQAHPRPERKP